MSRRDTIIVAVLINAGLLVVLLTTALKKDEGVNHVVISETTTPHFTEIPLRKNQATASDEVDQVLSRYTHTPTSQDNMSPQVTPEANFVQDLQAITTQSAQPVETTIPSLHEVAAQPSALASVSVTTIEVKVKKGDVLEKIAKTHGTSVDQIMKQNNLTSTRLKIGQVLHIQPNAQIAKAGVKITPTTPAASVASTKVYTVKNGDNPWTIAVKNHMKVEELLKLNNLNEEKARHLKPGDKLKIR